VPAQLWGLELEGRQRFDALGWRWEASSTLDLGRGENRSTGEALPRLAPWRLGVSLSAQRDGWRGSLGVRHAGRQTQVPSGDVATPSYTLWNASVALDQRWTWGQQALDATWFLKLDNLSNTLAYNATALRTARELSPLPGRAATVGLRVTF
jgi:iron complex outermembrane receptor protein